jgi:NAD(P)-dependent dehydrogenase (short-subunit alcohol dehydrogenase family)
MTELNEQSVLIVGAGGGIGRPTAIEIARRGAFVVLAERPESREAGEATLREVESIGGKALYVDLDVTSDASCAETIAEILAKRGQLHSFVNVAGIVQTGSIANTTIDEMQLQLDVHYLGPVRVFQHLYPHWRERGFGIFIPFTSIAAELPAVRKAAYSASKAAITNFALAMAQEHTHEGIRSIPMLASRVGTESARARAASSPEANAEMIGSQLLHEMIPPDVVARAVCYLLSPDGAWYGGDRFYITNGANVGLKAVNRIPDDG